MTNPIITSYEVVVASLSSYAIAQAVDFTPLLTALITFGVSIITIVGTEIIKFLVTFFRKKTEDLNKKSDNTDKQN